jgi:hypothetical protein
MRPRLTVWWLNPVLLFVGLNGGLAAVTALTPESVFLDRWYTPKFFDQHALILTVLCLAAFALGALLPELHFSGWAGPRERRAETGLPLDSLLALYRTAVALTLFGYTVWAAIGIKNGLTLQVVMDVLEGKPGVTYLIRTTYLPVITGVTTCTQFGIAAAVLAALIATQAGWRKVWKSLSLLFALAIVRALLNTERLAILEMAIPMLPVIASMVLGPRASRSRRLRLAIVAAPLAGIAGLFFLFAIFEYGRSWTTYYASISSESFWSFAFYRLTGYYVTALNNSSYLLTRLTAPLGVPFFTASFIWRSPLLSGLLKALFPNFDLEDTYIYELDAGANAEFNNEGGMLIPGVDFGAFGTILFWLAAGLVSGWAYRQFKRGSGWGVCLYPLLFLGIMEVPRGLYLTGGRATPPIVFLLLSAALLALQQRRAQAAARLAAPDLVTQIATS